MKHKSPRKTVYEKAKEGNSSKANTASFQFCSVSVRMGGA